MKIAIPTSDGKLCAHFGHCQAFTFAEIDENTKEIATIEEKIPDRKAIRTSELIRSGIFYLSSVLETF